MPTIQSNTGQVRIEGHPNECPFCHKTISPNYLYGHRNQEIMEVVLICPNQNCRRSFIGYYNNVQNKFFDFNGNVSIGNLVNKEFSEAINSISENFESIYNQAYSAEQYGLTEICGVGFRKALEYLIKDYIIKNNSSDADVVRRKFLGACISEYVDDERIKTVARRAVWLGNDETHYTRRWDDRDLNDLKKLIDLTIHWIEMEELTKSFEEEMPD